MEIDGMFTTQFTNECPPNRAHHIAKGLGGWPQPYREESDGRSQESILAGEGKTAPADTNIEVISNQKRVTS